MSAGMLTTIRFAAAAFARQAFNDAVMSYNTAREQFPGSLVANATGFVEAQLFELAAPAVEREAPRVAFG